jgi:hypothetical protein
VLDRFGAPAPFDEIALTAAYRISVLASGHDFVIFRTFKPKNGSTAGHQYRAGRVFPANLAAWR